MYAWEQIQLTLDYIENNIDKPFNIEDLSALASLSPFYYQRLFSRLVKFPVGEYIKQRRLSLSLDRLNNTTSKILDIALDLGFSSHEHFTKNFKLAFGMTPEEYKKSPKLLNYVTKPELALKHTFTDEGMPIIVDNMILEINKKTLDEPLYYMGLSATAPIGFIEGQGISTGDDPLLSVWDELHGQKNTFPFLDTDEELGVTLPCNKEGFFRYFAGAKVKFDTSFNLMEVWTLPKGKYLVCSIETENFKSLVTDVLYKALNYVYQTWIPKHHIKTDFFCAERYYSHKDDTQYAELWLRILD